LTIEITFEGRKKDILFRKQAQRFLQKNAWASLCVETNIPKNSKAIIMLAFCPGRCLLHHKGIEIDQTIFAHVTAGNVKFAVSQWPNSHPFTFLYETQQYRVNAILKILNSIIRNSRMLVVKKHLISCWAELLSKNCCWQAGMSC